MRMCLLTLLAVPVAVAAQDHRGASAANSARVVRDAIRLSIDERPDKTTLYVAIDDDRTPFPLTVAETLLARGPVSVVIRDPNPLSLSFTVSLTAAEDPSQTALAQLINALLTVATSASGLPGNVPADAKKAAAFLALQQKVQAGGTCEAETLADNRVNSLRIHLTAPESTAQDVAKAIARWRGLLEAAVERDGVRRALIDKEVGIIVLADARKELIAKRVAAAKDLLAVVTTEWERLNQKGGKLTDCERLARDIYGDAVADRPLLRISEMEQLVKDLDTLARGLESFASRRNWVAPDYRDYVLTPVYVTPTTMQEVSIRVAKLSYSVADSTGIVSKSTTQAEGKIQLRRYERLNVEIGAGVISAKIAVPKYGTVEKDGQTFAVKVKDDDVSWQLAVVGNFVCRCFDSTRLQPMFQIGALPAKDNPALLLGLGARLFGLPKGHFGFSAGLAWAWIKEIPDAVLLEPVSGTAEIEERKKRVERRRLYLMFQYVF
jgi:hypothetical protein